MSSFSGLNTAATALSAAKRGMDVIGQNIANQTTEGYTRQRLVTSAVAPVPPAGLFSTGVRPGHGVSVDGIVRLGDALLEARVRDAQSSAGYWSARAVQSTRLEAGLGEPGEDGLAARLDDFWAGWQDLSNTPDSPAAAAVVLQKAGELAGRIAGGYRAASDQWQRAREAADVSVQQVNALADQIAALNGEIRTALSAGRPANELIDQRGVLADQAARLVGARADVESDGTLTVRIDGNALVSGDRSRHVVLDGPMSIDEGRRTTLAWAPGADPVISLSGGELGGMLAVLAPADEGGPIASLAAGYDDVATALAQAVNELHRTGATAAGQPGGDFFALAAGVPAALGLSVAVSDTDELALATPGAGAHDATIADAISQIGARDDGPDGLWAQIVGTLAVSTAGDVQRSRVADAGWNAADAARRSVTAVDGDEETVNLLVYQTAYQAAARVLTAVDEALDVLINHVGLVGR